MDRMKTYRTTWLGAKVNADPSPRSLSRWERGWREAKA